MAVEIEVLIFELEGLRFGVRSTCVREVVRAVALSQIPQAPPSLEGVLNLRGKVVPVLDVRKLLGFQAKAMDHADHLLVLQTEDFCLAIRVDRAIDLMRLSTEAGETLQSRESPLIELVAKTADGLVDVINPARLLPDDETVSVIRAIELSAATEVNA
jgi:purine-binding chemotaxis protein CheW